MLVAGCRKVSNLWSSPALGVILEGFEDCFLDLLLIYKICLLFGMYYCKSNSNLIILIQRILIVYVGA